MHRPTIHYLEPEPLILPPWLVDRAADPSPQTLRDVLDLAEVEMPRWSRMLRSIDGPVAVSKIGDLWCQTILEGCRTFVIGNPAGEIEVRLAKGNPGPEFKENLAEEATIKKFKFKAAAGGEGAAARETGNEAAFEWVEVKKKEEYKFVVLRRGEFTPIGYAELTAPIAVEVGDTVRCAIGAMKLVIP
jgi:hypothetical protein